MAQAPADRDKIHRLFPHARGFEIENRIDVTKVTLLPGSRRHAKVQTGAEKDHDGDLKLSCSASTAQN